MRKRNINTWGQKNCKKSSIEEEIDPNFPLNKDEVRYFAKSNKGIICKMLKDGKCSQNCYLSKDQLNHPGCITICKGCYFVTNQDNNGQYPKINDWSIRNNNWYIVSESFKTSINSKSGRYLIDKSICKGIN